ncbi:relaxase [Streptococcus parauberis]|uniref:Relaxase/mobilization nuclease domain-containing protein n=1 Tax=Streptococcus parauberis TaxID=1348 RepID=A0AAE4L335_9STRE|nr:relaxase/mobilization nuclease domain-containing protein [Streptococcus parauberis]MDT2731008.1 relaxase/mobilization nuclease domain-containing protein [Streptococcus parauberis]MDT2749726.1 relaxase/mobilization nuclease domain-containing protein [Streptococcus parauberis]OHY31047.1 relaxase [Streptococcus parauberis]
MVYTKHKTVQSGKHLKDGIKYIINDTKTTLDHYVDSEFSFPLKEIENGELVSQLVSGHMVMDLENAGSEFLQIKQLANLQKGRKIDHHLERKDMVLAHHVIQSFSPDDNLTPEEIHEIGRKTALELTGGEHAFVVATHTDKDHIHNHIYINSTNEVTLNQFRWQKGTKRKLENISDRLADIAGAKIIDKQPQSFNHKDYIVYQKQNIFKNEIKSRLEHLLKYSTSLEDFKEKAKALNVEVDFSGKYVKYKLLDKEQKRNTRDSTLSKKGRYSLSSISKRLEKNQVGMTTEEVVTSYQKLQKEKDLDYEMSLTIDPWQVVERTQTGIYVEVDYGVRNQGLLKIPNKYFDELQDGKFELFVKRSDFFYAMNPDKSDQNRFLRGDTLIKQLSYHNGEMILSKNFHISKLDQLLKEFEYLSDHDVTSGEQFEELGDSFIEQLEEVEKVLNRIDETIAQRHKIASALVDYHSSDSTNKVHAMEILIQLEVSPSLNPDRIQKEITELTIERKALRDKLESITGEYEKYEEVKTNNKERQIDNEKTR